MIDYAVIKKLKYVSVAASNCPAEPLIGLTLSYDQHLPDCPQVYLCTGTPREVTAILIELKNRKLLSETFFGSHTRKIRSLEARIRRESRS